SLVRGRVRQDGRSSHRSRCSPHGLGSTAPIHWFACGSSLVTGGSNFSSVSRIGGLRPAPLRAGDTAGIGGGYRKGGSTAESAEGTEEEKIISFGERRPRPTRRGSG